MPDLVDFEPWECNTIPELVETLLQNGGSSVDGVIVFNRRDERDAVYLDALGYLEDEVLPEDPQAIFSKKEGTFIRLKNGSRLDFAPVLTVSPTRQYRFFARYNLDTMTKTETNALLVVLVPQ